MYDNQWDPDRPLQDVSCLLCGNAHSFPIHYENGFRVVRCTSCGFVFVNPRPAEEDLRSFYQKYYPDDPETDRSWRAMMSGIFRDARRRILAAAPAGRVLDVGCGLGYFLDEFQGTGWDAVGIDISADVARRARERSGADVRSGRLEDRKFPEDSFNAVTLFYLLEHTPDPVAVLRQVRRILRPRGLVLIRVPHMEPLIRLRSVMGAPRAFFHPPMHLCDLNPRVLHRILRDVGFERIRTTTGGATSPPKPLERMASRLSGAVAATLEKITGGTALLPGVSKTTIAYKPA
ncbi:MAG: class I SAM-dependent methyltransferase [Planctomycetota bacterium]|jgi:SAM-dependent methyltransferase